MMPPFNFFDQRSQDFKNSYPESAQANFTLDEVSFLISKLAHPLLPVSHLSSRISFPLDD